MRIVSNLKAAVKAKGVTVKEGRGKNEKEENPRKKIDPERK